MGLLRSELRRDLEIYDTPPTRLVRDPVTGTTRRFDEVQLALAQRFDGKRSAAEIADDLARDGDIEIAPAVVESFEKQLYRIGLLTSVPITSPAAERTGAQAALRRIRRAGLSQPPTEVPDAQEAIAIGLRLLAAGELAGASGYFALAEEVDPSARALRRYRDIAVAEAVRSAFPNAFPFPRLVLPGSEQIVEWVFGAFGFLCRRPIVVLQVLFVLSGLAVLPFLDSQGAPLMARDPVEWIMRFVSMIPGLFIHEMGHAVCCRHFGGRVREVGLMLVMGAFPAAFADVSSADAFPARGHRLWTSLAGSFVTLEIVAAAAWVGLLVPTGSIHQAALHVAWVNVILSFLNLCPFIPLDGYYVMMDWVGVPNLRSRAAVRVALPSLVERHGFARVGLVLTALFLALLVPLALGHGSIMVLVGGFAILCFVQVIRRRRASDIPELERRRVDAILLYQGLGMRAWSTFWMITFLGRLYTVFVSSWRGAGALLFFGLFLVPQVLLRFYGIGAIEATPQAARPRRLARWTMLASLAVAVGVLAIARAPRRCVVEGRVSGLEGGAVTAGTAGLLDQILVRTGQHVEAGQVVARLRDRALASEVARLEASRDQLRASINLLEAGLSREERRALQAGVEAARTALAGARDRSERMQAAREVETETVLRDALRERDQAGIRVAEADAVRAARGRLDREGLARAQARLLTAESRLDDALRRRALLEVRTPRRGVVVTPDLDLLVGTAVTPGARILEVYAPGRIEVELYVPLDESGAKIRPGRRVRARLQSSPSVGLRGRIETIDRRLREVAGSHVLVATTVLAGSERLPAPGARVHAAIDVGTISLLRQLLLPLEAYARNDFWDLW